ncbi:TPA: hypothetical protein ACIZB4_001241 [Legionella pneumophila]|jgi:hypothetical protein|nr:MULTISPECIES: hypothetical protein [Legionellaceae]MCW8418083.1 hypothetical protein [Fluoribacter dumoffii]MCW8465095.1 hypothetical protein [Legionella pneumophila]MCW8473389.1 hypothetical protein [Legionella pneumophila]MCW8491224.1 hypothetical protein [Legionella pneumophila]MCZ4682440.1 hypothetical protein [Legionella pneumophila]
MQSEFGKVEGNQRRLLDIGDSHSGLVVVSQSNRSVHTDEWQTG